MIRRAILIGVDRYSEEAGIDPLNAAVKDTRRVHQFLHSVRDYAAFEMAPPFGLVSDPTKEEALDAIQAATEGLAKGDLLLVYLAGHGATDSLTRQMLFLCQDADGHRLVRRQRTGNGTIASPPADIPGVISLADLETTIGNGPFDCVLICDMCRAEIDQQWVPRSAHAETVETAEIEDLSDEDMVEIEESARTFVPARPTNVSGTFVRLFSCRDCQRAYENHKDGGGLYTFSLCMAMKERWETVHYVAFDRTLSQTVERIMRQISKGRARQTPEERVIPASAELLLCDRRSGPPPRLKAETRGKTAVAEPTEAWKAPEVHISIGRFVFPAPPPDVPVAAPEIPERIHNLELEEYGIEVVLEQLANRTHEALVPALEHIQGAEQYHNDMREMAALSRPDGWEPETYERLEGDERLDRVTDPVDLLDELPEPPEGPDVTRYLTWVVAVHQAKRVHDELLRQFEGELSRETARLEGQLEEVRAARRAAQEEDFACVVCEFLQNAGQPDRFPMQQWSDHYALLEGRGYPWEYSDCLKRALRIFYTDQYRRLQAGEIPIEMRAEMLNRCAENGVTAAQKELALELRRDPQRAFALMEKAAREGGDPEAMYFLGLCYERGRGVDRDKEKSFYSYDRAAERGYAPAQYRVACILDSGGFGQSSNPAKSRRLLECAANQGHIDSMRKLAEWLRQEGEYERAVGILRRLRMMAAAGNRKALIPLGMEWRLRLIIRARNLPRKLSGLLRRIFLDHDEGNGSGN